MIFTGLLHLSDSTNIPAGFKWILIHVWLILLYSFNSSNQTNTLIKTDCLCPAIYLSQKSSDTFCNEEFKYKGQNILFIFMYTLTKDQKTLKFLRRLQNFIKVIYENVNCSGWGVGEDVTPTGLSVQLSQRNSNVTVSVMCVPYIAMQFQFHPSNP